tara:strand:- start:627 stop:860 length:234 start_codon:yes stop_codon:yes gene_type:complete
MNPLNPNAGNMKIGDKVYKFGVYYIANIEPMRENEASKVNLNTEGIPWAKVGTMNYAVKVTLTNGDVVDPKKLEPWS